MPDVFKTFKVTQPSLGGPLQESLVGAVQVSGGAPDAGKVVVLSPTGKLDPSIGSSVSVNGMSVANPDFNGTTPAAPGGSTNVIWQFDVSGNVSAYITTPVTSFSGLTSGTNTTAAMIVGSGATLTVTGSGAIEATDLATTGVSVNISSSAPPAHAGQLLISQPGNTTAVWADPLVQGLYPPGTNVTTGNSGGAINPVLIGAENPSALLENLNVDASGNLLTKDAADGTPGSPVPVTAMQIAGSDGTDLRVLATDSSGHLFVNTAGSFTPALTADRTAAGTITSTQSVSVSTQGGGAVTFQVEGTWTGELFFEGTTDGVNWVTVVAFPIGGGTTVSGITVPPAGSTGLWVSGCGGLSQFRVRGGSVLTGTATISLEVGSGTNGIEAQITGNVNVENFPGTQTVNGTVTANQGTAGTISQAWFTEITTDGANVAGTTAHPFVVNINNTPTVSVNNTVTANIQSSGTALTNTGGSLNVNITGGAGTTTQYQDPTTNANPFGTVALGKNPSNVLHSLALDASGNLNVNLNTVGSVKVSDGTNTLLTSAHPGITEDISDGTTGNTAPTTAIEVGGVDSGGKLRALSTDTSGNLNVNASFSGTISPALTADRQVTGTLTTTGNSQTVNTQGAAAVVFNILGGAWSGTITFQATVDGTNWVSADCYPLFTGGAAVSTITGPVNGQWVFPAGGVQGFRVFATSITGGEPLTVWLEAGAGAQALEVFQPTAANLNATVVGSVTANQGSQGVVTTPWFVAIADDSTSTIYGVNSAHPLQITGPVSFSSVISAGNSSTTPLAGNATFTGTGVSSLGYTALLINSFSDKASTVGGLQVQQSQDGTNWDVVDSFTATANLAFQTTVYVVGAFVRVVYTNTALAQATFRLQLVLQTAGDVTSRTLSTLGHTQVAIAEPLPTSPVASQSASAEAAVVGNVAYPLPTTSRMFNLPINFTSTGDNTIIPGVGGQTIRIWRILFVVGGTTNLTFKDGASNLQTGAMPFASQGAMVLDFSGEPWYITSSGNNWIINQSGTAQVSGSVWYTQS